MAKAAPTVCRAAPAEQPDMLLTIPLPGEPYPRPADFPSFVASSPFRLHEMRADWVGFAPAKWRVRCVYRNADGVVFTQWSIVGEAHLPGGQIAAYKQCNVSTPDDGPGELIYDHPDGATVTQDAVWHGDRIYLVGSTVTTTRAAS